MYSSSGAVGQLTCHNPFGCASLYICFLLGQSNIHTAFIVGITAEKGLVWVPCSEGRPVCITNSQENMVMLLLQLSGFTPMDVEYKLPDKRDQEHMSCQVRLSGLLQMLLCADNEM